MIMEKNEERVGSSFRDPSGYVFQHQGVYYRHIQQRYKEEYERLMQSGLYSALVDQQLMIPHEEVVDPRTAAGPTYKVIRPQQLDFVSYPYEWCFGELKDAALCLLNIQQLALRHGLSLKDGNAFNVQYHAGRPRLIDTLSFEIYDENKPWIAYRQFCQHFLAPLYLTTYKDVRLNQLLKHFLDGIPLDLASALLPFSSRFNLSALFHIHLHGRNQAKKTTVRKDVGFSRNKMMALIDNLLSSVTDISWTPAKAVWTHYYQETNYTDRAMNAKKQWVGECIGEIGPSTIWDIGANTGEFSRLARNANVIAFDYDEGVTEISYQRAKTDQDRNLLPLVMDMNNPSPGLGWAGEERMSLQQRGPADLVLALALIHHLIIGNNLSFSKVAQYFSCCGRKLLIEFVPKHDSQVQRLLSSRSDIFPDYTLERFAADFSEYFTICKSHKIEESERTIFLMAAK